jgi:hypothetical protein
MKRGVQVELCGATAAVHHWGNEDLLPGIKVNTNAIARMSQLAQGRVRGNNGMGLTHALSAIEAINFLKGRKQWDAA